MANETSGRRDNRVPFRASTKTPNIMMLRRTRFLLIAVSYTHLRAHET